MKYEERLSEFLSTCDGKVRNVFFDIYCILESIESANQPAALMFVCENAFKMKSDSSRRIEKEYYTVEQAERAEQKIGTKFMPIFDELVQDYSKKNVAPIKFYTEVWNLMQSSIFRSKREKALALFRVVDHDLIPYRSVGVGITMENETFWSIADALEENALADMEYILKLDYDQKTQRASLLLDKMLGLNSKDEQTVYLALLMKAIENNIREEIKEALDNI